MSSVIVDELNYVRGQQPRRSICGYCFKQIVLPVDYVFPEILKCPRCKAEWLPLSKFAATEPNFPEEK